VQADLLQLIIETFEQAQLIEDVILNLKIILLHFLDGLAELADLGDKHASNLLRLIDQVGILLQFLFKRSVVQA